MKKLICLAGSVTLLLMASAMPTKKELKSVQGLVNELMSADLQSCKAGNMKATEVAAKAEGYARDAETEAAKFLLLKGSFGFYMQGEEYGEALRVLNLLTTTVPNIPDKVMAEIVVAKLKRLSKDKGTAIFEYYERLNQRMNMAEERVKLEKVLKENPKSKEAQRDLAVCLAVLGDWKGALAHFAKAGGKEAEAAQLEGSGTLAPAADLWWEAAQGDATDVLRAHAAELYRQAIADGQLKGLKLTLAKKRVAEVTPAAIASSGGRDVPVASERTQSVGFAPRADRSNAGSAATPQNAKLDWTIPANFKGGIRTVDLDLGCPEKMTFFAVPPGEGKLGGIGNQGELGRFVCTRPFWVSQFCVTVGQLEALGLQCHAPNVVKLAEACKNDKSVAVRAFVSLTESDRFYELLNQKFGGILPQGIVFRPLTLAEFNRAEKWSLEMRFKNQWGTFAANPDRYFEIYRKKGFFTDCTSAEEMRKSHWKKTPGHVLVDTLEIDYAQIREMREIARIRLVSCFQLDAISDRGLLAQSHMHVGGGVHTKDYVKAIGEYLRGSLKETDPFWYSEKGTETRLIGYGGYTFMPETGTGRCAFIRVAVGHDYVGEWKRTHGK